MRTGKSQIVVEFAKLRKEPVMILPSDYIDAGIAEIAKNDPEMNVLYDKDTKRLTRNFVLGWLKRSLVGGYNLDIVLEGPWFDPDLVRWLETACTGLFSVKPTL